MSRHDYPHDTGAEEAIIGYLFMYPDRSEPVLRALTPEDFYEPVFRRLFTAYDPALTMRAVCEKAGPGTEHAATVSQGASAMHSTLDRHLVRVQDLSARRTLITAASAAMGQARDPGEDVAAAAETISAALDDLTPRGAARALDGEEFLAGTDDPYDWLIPGLMERGERLLVTAGEGKGKSVLLRQIAVGCATGIHPLWPTVAIPVATVLLIDLENSERQVRRKLRPLRVAANVQLTNLHVEVRSSGIDLTRRGDAQWLTSLVATHRPDLLVIGPLYRMFGGSERHDVGGENQARQVAAVLDRCRALSGCALLMETHAPHGGVAGRDLRPFGSSVWLRWPEFGLGLAEDRENPGEVNVVHWRGPRDERDWPAKLTRGGKFPWSGYWPAGFKSYEHEKELAHV